MLSSSNVSDNLLSWLNKNELFFKLVKLPLRWFSCHPHILWDFWGKEREKDSSHLSLPRDLKQLFLSPKEDTITQNSTCLMFIAYFVKTSSKDSNTERVLRSNNVETEKTLQKFHAWRHSFPSLWEGTVKINSHSRQLRNEIVRNQEIDERNKWIGLNLFSTSKYDQNW